jgi:Cu(I)/Ag(I) efflux system membrane fusion protein
MSETIRETGTDTRPAGGEPRGLRWWLRVIEVRLRFIGLMVLALVIVTQWGRLRGIWDDWWHSLDGAPAPAVSADTEYFCPMDPGVVSTWPAVCPICNMDLVQRRKHDAQLLPEGVVSRMQLTPYRVQLAGIRTAAVERRPLTYELVLAGTLETAADRDGLSFEAAVSRQDRLLFAAPRDAVVFAPGFEQHTVAGVAELAVDEETSRVRDRVPRVRVTVADQSEPELFMPGLSARAVVSVPAAELLPDEPQSADQTLTSEPVSLDGGPASDSSVAAARPTDVLAVVESAVVDHGRKRFVFVESMPGTFDAVEVSLGRRAGDYYPVLSGLQAGQNVAVAGAFLIDAEARLNPSLAVGYFGANQSDVERRLPEVRLATDKSGTALSPEQRELARRQGTCPVTGLSLDAMGGPLPVTVEGRTVFICCRGCEGKLKSDPQQYLSKLGTGAGRGDD